MRDRVGVHKIAKIAYDVKVFHNESAKFSLRHVPLYVSHMQRNDFDNSFPFGIGQFKTLANSVCQLRADLSVRVHIACRFYRFRFAYIVQKCGESQSRRSALKRFDCMLVSVVYMVFFRLFKTFERGKFGQKHIHKSEVVEHSQTSDVCVFEVKLGMLCVRNENLFKLVAYSFDGNIFDAPCVFLCDFVGVFFDVESEFRRKSDHSQNAQSVRLENDFRLVGG